MFKCSLRRRLNEPEIVRVFLLYLAVFWGDGVHTNISSVICIYAHVPIYLSRPNILYSAVTINIFLSTTNLSGRYASGIYLCTLIGRGGGVSSRRAHTFTRRCRRFCAWLKLVRETSYRIRENLSGRSHEPESETDAIPARPVLQYIYFNIATFYPVSALETHFEIIRAVRWFSPHVSLSA